MEKRNLVLALVALIVIIAVITRSCSSCNCEWNFESYNPDYPPPSGTPANQIFHLSQDYPDEYAPETGPWTTIDFRTDPQAYGQAILAYCLEGNINVDFKGQDNAVRKWYHAPWLHFGENGREWHHGLTRERNSRPGELGPSQTSTAFSWAVGFYNAKGGYTLGKVWEDCENKIPDPAQSNFPEGTVSFKLLFSSASNAQVPYLQNSFTWVVNTGPPNNSEPGSPGWVLRTDGNMRLLQVDIAVKDNRSPVGWVFGTFVYDGFAAGATPWERLQLVGLIWGNDTNVSSRINDEGAFINPDLRENWINAALIPNDVPTNEARAYHLGLGGRLNGPVDNPISSCISCHGKASVLKDTEPDPIDNLGRMPRMFATGNIMQMNMLKFNDFFGTNIPPGTGDITYNCFISGFGPCSGPSPSYEFIKTDYSLQVAVGIENFYESLNDLADKIIRERQENRR